jgi:hypothetical protein
LRDRFRMHWTDWMQYNPPAESMRRYCPDAIFR